MNLDISPLLAGIVVLNAIALGLWLTAEVRARRRGPAEPVSAEEPPIGLDRWIAEIEAVEQRQEFASGGQFSPQHPRAVNG